MSDIANNNLRLTCWNFSGIFGSFTYVKNLLQRSDILALSEHWLYHDNLPFLSSLDTRFKVYATSSPLNNKNVRWRRGLTADIPVLSGVKQGCPLSPIIFNLTIDLIIRAIKRTASDIGPTKVYDIPFSVLAYADHLVIISRKKDRLQKLLNAAS